VRFIKCKDILIPLKGVFTDGKKMSEAFWTVLLTLISFLEPFKIATDLVQQDAASMNTFYCAFISVRNKCTSICNQKDHILSSVAKTAVDAINNHWSKYISNELYTIIKLLIKDDTVTKNQLSHSKISEFDSIYIYI
jgi:hypothetical protein